MLDLPIPFSSVLHSLSMQAEAGKQQSPSRYAGNNVPKA
jgi:hypothetical protein